LVSNVGDDQWSEVMNFAEVSDKLVFDIMGELCFGTSFDVKEPGENPFKAIPHAAIQYVQFLYPVRLLACKTMLVPNFQLAYSLTYA
jgi:hypothetical protein